MTMRIAMISFILLSSLSAHSAELALANRFLDEHPLAASDGQHATVIIDQINRWTNIQHERETLQSNMFVFAAIQVTRGTKAVSVISPFALHGNRIFDLRKAPIWEKLMAHIAENPQVKVVEYDSETKIALPSGQPGILSGKSYIFINQALANSDEIVNFFKNNRRNINYHPQNDLFFIVEGYLFGYSHENIEAFYNRPDSRRSLKFDLALQGARAILNKLGVEDPAILQSEHQKFANQR